MSAALKDLCVMATDGSLLAKSQLEHCCSPETMLAVYGALLEAQSMKAIFGSCPTSVERALALLDGLDAPAGRREG